MTSQQLKSARAIAVEVLNRCDPKKNYAGTILDRIRHETDQSQRATDLVFGTLRNRKAIDMVIAKFSGRPVKRIQSKLLNIIRVGIYELIYCPSTEQYAIVNEAVVNAKVAGAAKQSGFVNAVLRQITRHISNRQVILAESDAGCTLPQTPISGCQFDTSFLPDREINPAEYLSTIFSLPEWLLTGWLAEFDKESTRRICFASNRRPGVYIRPNRLKTTVEALTEKLAAAKVEFEIILPEGTPYSANAEMIRIKNPRNVTQLPGFTEGHFTIQDIAASKPVRMLNDLKLKTKNLKLLDLCAAPGTKTTQLAEVTGDSAKIIATDIDNRRLEMVRKNIARLGIKSVDVVPYEELPGIFNPCFHRDDVTPAKAGGRMPDAESRAECIVPRAQYPERRTQNENVFDCVLLDVPCSNTGVLARRVEARYRINPETIGRMARIQSELLGTAAGLVRPGGKICYSTCSIQKAENSQLIEDFLEQNKNFTLESEQLTLPSAEGFDHDGGYAAILAKRQTQN